MEMTTFAAHNLPRQQGRVLVMLADGKPEKSISREMGIALQTVKGYKSTLFYRLKARNTPSAIAQAFAKGHLKIAPVVLLCVLTGFSGMDERIIRPPRRGRETEIRLEAV
jgi:DNA-binding CsgD family transcriptional regulator